MSTARRADQLRAFLGEAPEIGPGTLVSERVRLKKRIATGGMGTVWRAEHTTLGVDVAVKLLTDDVRDDPDAITRFHNEASTASRLASAHVVKVLDFGLFAGDTPYLVMELLDGEDLAARIARAGPRSPAQVGDILEQAARGLVAAHDVGFIHRDVKPQNLFLARVDGEEIVKLLDFGVARRPIASQTTTTKSGQLLGTPLYMGPEQLTRPSEIDARADVWSLAVVAYEALTGRLPFDGETVGALAIAVDRGLFTPPSEARPGIPSSLDAWFRRAFAKDVGERFQTANELSHTFKAALETAPGRRPWLLAAALVAGAGTAVVALASSLGPAATTSAGATTGDVSAPTRSSLLPPSAIRPSPAQPSEGPRAASVSTAASAPTGTLGRKTAAISATPHSERSDPAKTAEPAAAAPLASEKPRKDRGF